MELLRAFHRILAKHGVGDEEDLVRVDRVLEFAKFLHQRFIDVKPPGRVYNHDIVRCIARFAQSTLTKIQRFVVRIAFPNLYADVFGDQP